MKKILSLIGAASLTAAGASSVIACKKTKEKQHEKRTKEKVLMPVVEKSILTNLTLVQPPNSAKNKRSINFEKEFNFYNGFKKLIINFDKIKSKIISFFKDNYSNDYFITDDGLYLLKNKNNKLIKIKNINSSNIWYINFDSKNNMYFSMYSVSLGSSGGEIYMLKHNETTAQKINGINERIFNINIDNNNNVYFDSNNGLYILKSGEANAILNKDIKKYGFYKKTLGFDEENNLYFTTLNNTYVLKNNENEPNKIDNLNDEVTSLFINKNKVYFATVNGAYFLKQGETTVTKINGIEFLNKNNKVNYFLFDKKYIYIGCLYKTYILDYNYKIIKLLPNSHCYIYNNNGTIYFGTGRGIYKFNPNTMKYQKIKIKNINNLYDSDDEIMDIYYINDNIYFKEYTRQSINFYKINSNDLAEKIDNLDKILIQ
uniref:lipoprotein n=1 Tax=Spiroplasma citri TaxID=2133 RepID=UPI0037DD7D47